MVTPHAEKAFMRLPGALRAALFYLIQWTWGLPQNIAGLALLLLMGPQPRARMHGALVTFFEKNRVMKGNGAVSLGMFIFIPAAWGEEYSRMTAVHEYGHTVQSMILGPLYLIAVGLPSLIWASVWSNSKKKAAARGAAHAQAAEAHAPAEGKSRKAPKRRVRIADSKYTSRYPENWANTLGEYVTGEQPPRD